jgi:hypothetical protein
MFLLNLRRILLLIGEVVLVATCESFRHVLVFFGKQRFVLLLLQAHYVRLILLKLLHCDVHFFSKTTLVL